MEYLRYLDGVPSWVDHSSPDPAAAAEFYSGLLGWSAPEGPAEMGGYRVCTLRDHLVAGIGPQMSPGPVVWTTYVNVDDVDAAAARVEAHGGKALMGPMDVMTAGRLALISDPAGAVIGLWQPNTHPGATLVNEPGTFCWCELLTTDVPGASEFYGAVFGWQSRTTPAGEENPAYTEFQREGRSIAGMMEKPAMLPAEIPPFWNVYFAVEDLEAALKRSSELGGQTRMGPMETPQGPFAAIADPQGGVFNLIALRELPSE